MVGKLKSLIFQAVLRVGTSPWAPSRASPLLSGRCFCVLTGTPSRPSTESGWSAWPKVWFAPWAGSDLPGSCAHGSRMSTVSGPFLGPHVGGEPDCQFGPTRPPPQNGQGSVVFTGGHRALGLKQLVDSLECVGGVCGSACGLSSLSDHVHLLCHLCTCKVLKMRCLRLCGQGREITNISTGAL